MVEKRDGRRLFGRDGRRSEQTVDKYLSFANLYLEGTFLKLLIFLPYSFLPATRIGKRCVGATLKFVCPQTILISA